MKSIYYILECRPVQTWFKILWNRPVQCIRSCPPKCHLNCYFMNIKKMEGWIEYINKSTITTTPQKKIYMIQRTLCLQEPRYESTVFTYCWSLNWRKVWHLLHTSMKKITTVFSEPLPTHILRLSRGKWVTL